MADNTELVISGGGSVAVSTDAMLADADRLRTLVVVLPTVASGLRHAAGMVGPAEAAMVTSGKLREADVALNSARQKLDLAIEECAHIANALDAAAINYGRAEREVTARFTAAAEQLAALAGDLVGETVARNPMLARAVARLAMAALRDLLGESVAPGDVEFPAGLNAILSSPDVVKLLRSMVMAGDDFGAGVLPIPESVRESYGDVGLGALLALMLGSMSGLFGSTPVTTTLAGREKTTTPVTGVADRGSLIPNAVAGEKPQVRIDKYSAPGQPDRYEVYIGGTIDFSPLVNDEAFDLTSNFELMAGLPAGSFQGVLDAMAMAGITKDSHVVLTGHSQGALIASTIAASGDYTVDALLSFGGPIGQVAIPSSVSTLIVENFEDPVVAVGGTQSNHHALIVQREVFPGPGGLPAGVALPGHHIEPYLETAAAIDEEGESSQVKEFTRHLTSLTSGYEEATTQKYLIRRTD